MLVELVLFVLTLACFQTYRTWRSHRYWADLGVPCPPIQFPFGNSALWSLSTLLRRRHYSSILQEQYEQMEGHRFYGNYAWSTPQLVIRDPALGKALLVKDFDHFVDRVIPFIDVKGKTPTDVLWSKRLGVLRGQEWRNVRHAFSPIFTPNKLKMMLPLMYEVADRLLANLAREHDGDRKFELKDKMGKFSMDVIASCAFGLQANSFDDDDDRDNNSQSFLRNSREIFARRPREMLLHLLITFVPPANHLLGWTGVSLFKPDVINFFKEIISGTLKHRRETGQRRNDMIDIILDLMKETEDADKHKDVDPNEKHVASQADKIEIDETLIISQAMIFMAAGYDTTGQTLSFAAYELAMNPEIQRTLQDEVDAIFEAAEDNEAGRPGYYALQEMPYMDQVIHEVLRLHPALFTIARFCTQDYTIPPSEDSSKEFVEECKEYLPDRGVHVKKGQEVFFNAAGIYQDPEIFPEPTKFNPDRFTKDSRARRSMFTFMSFGQGPRVCIAVRFALLEMKLALASILRLYNLVPCPDTPRHIQRDPGSVLAASKAPLWAKVERRTLKG